MLKKKIKLDPELRPILKKHGWHENSNGYIKAKINKRMVNLHHLVLPVKKGFDVDHINRDKYDNRRSNLRYATRSQNKMNSAKFKTNTSGFRGVTWAKDRKKWRVYICVKYKTIRLGSFDDIEDAARAYKEAALKYFNEFMGEL